MAPGLMWLNSVQGLTTVIPTFTPAKQSLLSGTRKLVSIWFALDPETQQTKKQNKFSLANSHVQWLTQAGWEPHLFCNVYHYKQDDYLLERYPHRMWQCGCDHSFWCFDAGQCGWTNNPIMYGRDWWLKNFVRLPAIVFSTITDHSPLYSMKYPKRTGIEFLKQEPTTLMNGSCLTGWWLKVMGFLGMKKWEKEIQENFIKRTHCLPLRSN